MPAPNLVQPPSVKRNDTRASATKTLHDMTAQTAPQDGDVVVRREKLEGRFVYLLHTVPGTAQYVLRTREEAVAQAMTFAKRHGVCAWVSDGRDDCERLSEVRVAESN